MARNYVKDTHINQNDYGLEELERGDGPDDLDDDDDLLGNNTGCRARRRRVGRRRRCDDDDAGENDDDDDDTLGGRIIGSRDGGSSPCPDDDDDDHDDDDDGVNRRRRRPDDDDDDDDTLGGRIIGSRDGGSSHGSNDEDDDDGVNRRRCRPDDDDDDDDHNGVNRWRVAGGLYCVAGGLYRVAGGLYRVAGGLYRVAGGLYRVACSGAPIGPLRIVGPPFNKTQLSTSRGARRPRPLGGGGIVGTTRALGNLLTLLITALGNFLVFPFILPSLLDDHLALGDIFTTTSLRRLGPRGGGCIGGTTRAFGNIHALLMTALGNFLVFPLTLPSLLDDQLALEGIFTTTSLRRLGPRGGRGIIGTT